MSAKSWLRQGPTRLASKHHDFHRARPVYQPPDPAGNFRDGGIHALVGHGIRAGCARTWRQCFRCCGRRRLRAARGRAAPQRAWRRHDRRVRHGRATRRPDRADGAGSRTAGRDDRALSRGGARAGAGRGGARGRGARSGGCLVAAAARSRHLGTRGRACLRHRVRAGRASGAREGRRNHC